MESPAIRGLVDADQILRKLLTATLKLERKTADRDIEIAAIQRKFAPAIDTLLAEISGLESEIQTYYEAHAQEFEAADAKTVQLEWGVIGIRSPSNPALELLNDRWTWEGVARRLKRLWKAKYFHKPKPPGIDKVKVKRELSAEQLKDCGLRLDDTQTFYWDLNRMKQPDELLAESRAAA